MRRCERENYKQIVAFHRVLTLVVSTEYYVLHWTNNLAIEAGEQQKRLAQLDQIPTLNHELNAMRNDNSIAQARAQQQVSDIGQTNDDLKASIEKKDAQLATIAEKHMPFLTFASSICGFKQHT